LPEARDEVELISRMLSRKLERPVIHETCRARVGHPSDELVSNS
jgi:hypothetical protein